MEIAREIERVLELESSALLACSKRIASDPAPFVRAIELMKDSLESGGKLIVTGIGKSGKIGEKIAATFSSTGSMAVFLHPTEGVHGDLGLVAKGDAVLLMSYSGNTEELLKS